MQGGRMATSSTSAAAAARKPAGLASLSPQRVRTLKLALWLLALLPFVRLLYLGATEQFGANPLEFVTRSTGTWTLVMLCLTLTITPLRRLTGWNWLIKLRRMLGLFAFFYGLQHFLLWIGVDRGFDLAYMIKDVYKRPFITVGFTAFMLMIPLALTSTNGMVRWLGGKRWQALHKLVYAIAVLAILHYWWHKAGKNDFGEVSIYAAVVFVLLGMRLWWRLRKPAAGARQPAA
ncbi:protein-methionine-sulfoxide reductase heme-binding subunit MsrQ [Cupriavidus sp. UYPR2.512]|uniref:protein-methionine-sulfoxide reductase heme-binding subunit MsrQ n=1 Tax=Cupriavidus sp. UYPR2.512 TaxID=1080187 RepID=UPI0003696B44|nr:protein-methionine-sulfoxide reductase heme-binding subunit MsrQ [Cupriavidus sp. UYPR2.512]UIF85950.1 protein-methionine-sulfoxide reductase heme-binding subunit MsrQ [Cupriavidus necator]